MNDLSINDINQAFNENWMRLNKNVTPQEQPTAYVLGGQPRSGKSKLSL